MALSVEKVAQAQLHVGTRKAEAHPKTGKFWLGIKNDIVVINPETIIEQLDTAKEKVQSYLKAGRDVLFITPQATIADQIGDLAAKGNFHYLNDKIPSGFLTNFDVLKMRIGAMNTLRNSIASSSFEKLTKKEKMMKKRALRKVERVYRGVQNLSKKPDLVVVLDGVQHAGLVDELETTGIENIVISSTNFNRWRDGGLVIANVGSQKSIVFMLEYLLAGKAS